jgi:hypothetical protein
MYFIWYGNRGGNTAPSILDNLASHIGGSPYHRGAEHADKGAWTFGTVSTASNGSYYNVTLGTMKYLIQRNWVNSGNGFCAMSF